MNKYGLLLVLLILPQPVLHADHARQMAEAFEMRGLSDVVRDQAREVLSKVMGEKFGTWMVEKLEQKAKEIAASMPDKKINVRQLIQTGKLSPEEFKQALREKLRDYLPQAVKIILYDKLLQGELSGADQQYFEAIEKKITEILNTSLNDQADQVLGRAYDQIVNRVFQQWNNPAIRAAQSLEALRNEAVASFARGGFLTFVTDQLDNQIGHATVQAFQQNMLSLLHGELPAEALQYLQMGPDKFEEYAEKVKTYLPSAQFAAVKEKIFKFPAFNMPNQVYGGILAARAADYFARFASSCSGFGVSCNWVYFNRGRQVVQTMIAQLRNKEAISITVGDLFDLSQLGGKLGISDWGAWEKISNPNFLRKWGEQLNQLESKLAEIDKWYDENVQKISDELKKATGEIQKELLDFSNQLLEPLRKVNKQWEEAVHEMEQMPDVTPPKDWEEFKKNAGLPDKLLGEEGEKTPKEILEEQGERVTGPKAEIKEEEKIPAQHPSQESDFDPVLLHNGEFFYKATDVTIPGRDTAMPFQFTRIYRSRSDFMGVLGQGWTHNWAMRLFPWNDGVTYINEEGKKFFFARDAQGRFIRPKGLFVSLENNALTFSDGSKQIFDTEGFLKAIENPAGHRMECLYNETRQLVQVTDSSGRPIRFEYNEQGLMTAFEDFGGRRWRFEFDPNSQLIGATTPALPDFPKGKTTGYRYQNKNLTLIMDPKGEVYLQNFYGTSGEEADRVVQQFYGSEEAATKARYFGKMVLIEDRRGTWFRYLHNDTGQLIEKDWVRSPGDVQSLVRHQYNEEGLRTETAFPSGRKFLWRYDDWGRIVETTEVASDGKTVRQLPVTDATQAKTDDPAAKKETDIFGNVTASTDAEGNTRRFEVNVLNEITREILPQGIERKYAYDANDNLIRMEVAPGVVHTFEYGVLDRMTKKREQTGPDRWIETRYDYDPQGHLTGLTLPEGNRVHWEYDPLGRVVRQTEGVGTLETRSKRWHYDLEGHLLESCDPLNHCTRFERDGFGRIAAKIYPLGRREEWQYDLQDRIVSHLNKDHQGHLLSQERFQYDPDEKWVERERLLWRDDPRRGKWIKDRTEVGSPITTSGMTKIGEMTKYRYDAIGRIVETIQGAQSDRPAVTRWEWDGNGRLRSLTDAEGRVTRYDYDSLDRLIREQPPDGTEWFYSYDDADHLVGILNAEKEAILLGYDAEGNLIKRRGNHIDQEWEYDSLNRLTRGRDQQMEFRLRYDSFSQPIAEAVNGQSIETVWNATGRPSAIRYPSGLNVFKSFDPQGRPQSVYTDARPVAQWHYEQNRLSELKQDQAVRVRFGFDAMERLSAQQWELAGMPWREEQYRYNGNSQLLGFNYDPYNRLHDFPLDLAGNRTDLEGLQFDPNGNLISDSRFQFDYDGLDRLIAVRDKATQAPIAAYKYDVLGRRIKKDLVQAHKTIHYRYDGWNLIEARQEGGPTREFIYGEGLDELLSMIVREGSGEKRYFYLKDRIGSIIGLTDAAGLLVEEYHYDAHGVTADRSRIGNIFTFAGRELDEETGLMNFRHRYYAPTLGRFITRDPLGYKNRFYAASNLGAFYSVSYHRGAGGASRATFAGALETDLFHLRSVDWTDIPEMSPTAYAINDPVNWYDPWGLFSMVVRLPMERDHAGNFYLFGDDDAKRWGPYSVLGRSSNDWGNGVWNPNKTRNPLFKFGDTPTGLYEVGRAEPRADIKKYGPNGVLPLDPIFGDAQTAEDNERSGLLIHGGRANSKYKFDGLAATQGCLRLSDANMAQLVGALAELRQTGDDDGTLLVLEKPLSFFEERW